MRRFWKIAIVICLLSCFAFMISSFLAVSVNIVGDSKTEIVQQAICPKCGAEAVHQGLYCNTCGAVMSSTQLVVGILVSGIGFALIPLIVLLVMEIADHRQTLKQIQENQAEIARLISSFRGEKRDENK